jgi:roadblock/LC7 domain-containing protein
VVVASASSRAAPAELPRGTPAERRRATVLNVKTVEAAFTQQSFQENDPMTSLDQLMKIGGVVAAGEFADDGKLLDIRGSLAPEIAEAAAQFCGTVNMTFKTLSGAFQQTSGMKWTPAKGWAFSGGEYSVCVGGGKGVFVETAKANFNELFKALVA